jgi:hypothetical protein
MSEWEDGRDSRHDPFVRLSEVRKDVSYEPVRPGPVEQLAGPPTCLVELDLP